MGKIWDPLGLVWEHFGNLFFGTFPLSGIYGSFTGSFWDPFGSMFGRVMGEFRKILGCPKKRCIFGKVPKALFWDSFGKTLGTSQNTKILGIDWAVFGKVP
eukprot:jgi/Botrbrau1/355/Bobra.110_2s0013.1